MASLEMKIDQESSHIVDIGSVVHLFAPLRGRMNYLRHFAFCDRYGILKKRAANFFKHEGD